MVQIHELVNRKEVKMEKVFLFLFLVGLPVGILIWALVIYCVVYLYNAIKEML